MTPADILTAARANPLSPIVPAREDWLDGYEGPLRYMGEHGPIAAWRIGGGNDHHHVVLVRGLSVDAVTCGAQRLRFDLRIPSVRDWIVRCCVLPASLRDHVAAAVAAGPGVHVRFALGSWEPVRSASLDNRGARWGIPRREECFGLYGPRGWELYLDGREPFASGPEEGMVGARTGRLAVDLAALRAGCVLEEADGWYIPLPGGAVGWLPKETA